MIHTLLVATILLLIGSTGMPVVSAQEMSGDVKQPIARCVPMSALTSRMAPPELYGNAVQCWVARRKEDARNSFVLAGAYGRYDTARVSGRTAHQVLIVLQMQIGEILGLGSQAFVDSLQTGDMPARRKSTCAFVQRLGPPTYTPTYMTSHGMGAFRGTGTAQTPGFNGAATWAELRTVLLRCDAGKVAPHGSARTK